MEHFLKGVLDEALLFEIFRQDFVVITNYVKYRTLYEKNLSSHTMKQYTLTGSVGEHLSIML